MKFYPPTTVSINAQSDEGKALGEQYVREAKVMLVGLRGRQQDGVQIVGQTRTLPNGVRIKVGMSDNDVSQMGWVQIDVPEVIKPVPPEYERLEERGDYIWIGMKMTSGGMPLTECTSDDGLPTGYLILWVWEPPAEGELPGIISAWREMLTRYHEPVIPDLEGGTRADGTPFTTGPGDFFRLPSGAYLIHRYSHDPGIISPVTEDEDGDDLWHQVFVMDPGDGNGDFNVGAFYDQDPMNPQAQSDHMWLASRPTYLMPDHPDYVDSENQPDEREEPSPATVMWAPDPDWQPIPPEEGGGEDQKRPAMPYLAKVFYLTPACEETEAANGRLKIISGKRPYTVIDRYDFVIEQGNWKPRAALPRGVYDSEADWRGNSIPAGDNVMDYGWSEETWEVFPMFGSRIADEERLPFGLNRGELPEPECLSPVAFTGRFMMSAWSVDAGLGDATQMNYAWYIPLSDIEGVDGGVHTVLHSYQPQDRCGNSIFGPASSVSEKWPPMVTVYQADAGNSGFNGLWMPGSTDYNDLSFVSRDIAVYGDFFSEYFYRFASPLVGWVAYLVYLPLTNEWIEVSPQRGLSSLKQELYDRGYAFLSSIGFAGSVGSFVPTYQ